MRYQEHPPAASGVLTSVVETIWTLESDGPCEGIAAAEPVIPDGRSEIIIHFSDPFERAVGAAFERQDAIFVVGQLTSPLMLRPGRRVSVLGIRLRPEGAAGLWSCPQHELAGRTIDPANLSAPLARWLAELRDRYDSAETAAGHVAAGLSQVIARERLDARVAGAVSLVLDSHGATKVDALASRVGCTRRHLERLFLDQVGITPKRLGRIRRFQWAISALEQAQAAGVRNAGLLAATASGYADQSHFVHDFREFAGSTPTSDLLQRAALTGLFVG